MIDPTHELRRLLRQAAAGAELEPALAQLVERLLDAALEQAERRGIRAAARTVPHELAQPLSEVRGYAELLVEGGYSDEETRDFLQRIATAAARAGDLIHAIGRLGRADQPLPRRRTIGGEELLLLPTEGGEAAEAANPTESTDLGPEQRRFRLRRFPGSEDPTP